MTSKRRQPGSVLLPAASFSITPRNSSTRPGTMSASTTMTTGETAERRDDFHRELRCRDVNAFAQETMDANKIKGLAIFILKSLSSVQAKEGPS
mmetsp:Transcript_87039/g.174128  ORF Transcript_87039/g.174128 Transcript_87039/m.174128 type:complete len:94 (+) Transcript_87039:539-820(+)